MEEKIVKTLNWYYYGMMVLSLIALTVMYYLFSKGMYEPIDTLSTAGVAIQYIVIGLALVTIPGGLYMMKFFKPDTLDKYRKIAIWRILLVSSTMPFGIIAFYLLGGYRSMLWIAAISAISWYFTKPTLGKIEAEMKPQDPNIPTY